MEQHIPIISTCNELFQYIFDACPATAFSFPIQIKQSHVRNLQVMQQSPEMVDVPSSQRNDRYSAGIYAFVYGFPISWEDDLFTVSFSQNNKLGKIKFWIGPDGFLDIFILRLQFFFVRQSDLFYF